ncbi:hypothetical protein [Halodesulfovibrio marinisediminis]|uniref:Uncharacterized protein n=1 Tax=Halodesulfovibrio marinisediminis DSM 17456 TaxID=1121457 RepID=A0A1N6DR92_9BACT|nr:hypothetical protein [Halodesulfovibrio marinisediminis]SIN73217.1 hypothetical protein SAMN02745161_0408 [Halodesulfovibrio marinisediminis DSM 17456]
MLDSLVGTILTDARTVLDDLDPFLLELEVSAERSDAALLSTINNTTPLLSNCFNLLGLIDAVALVDLLQLVTGAFRKQTLSLSYVNIREVIRAFSALVAFLDSADAEKISIANNALKELVEEVWPSESHKMLATHSLRDSYGNVAFSIAGHVLDDDFMQECTCYVLELDESGVLAGTQFTPFSLLQFLYKSGQVLDVQFAPPESDAYLQVLFATVLDTEQLQLVLDLPESAIHAIYISSFGSTKPAWTCTPRVDEADDISSISQVQDNAYQESKDVQRNVASSDDSRLDDGSIGKLEQGSNPWSLVADEQKQEVSQPSSADNAAIDKFALLEAELEGELFEEALSAGIEARSFDRAKQELPEKSEPVSGKQDELPKAEQSAVAAASDSGFEERHEDVEQEPTPQVEELHGLSYKRDQNRVTLYVSTVENAVEAEQLRAALLELLASHADVELVLCAPIRGNLELLQLLLSAAMTAGLRRQKFRVSGDGKDSVGMLLAGCGITVDVLKAQGIADFLG